MKGFMEALNFSDWGQLYFSQTLHNQIPVWYWSTFSKVPLCSLRCYGGKLLSTGTLAQGKINQGEKNKKHKG